MTKIEHKVNTKEEKNQLVIPGRVKYSFPYNVNSIASQRYTELVIRKDNTM